MEKNGTKKASRRKQFGSTFLLMAIGGVVGILLGLFMAAKGAENGLLDLTLLLVGLAVSVYIQVIAHEGGHYIFGRLTGYCLASFWVDSVVWVRTGGRVLRKRYKLPGTLGQCLMIPPACGPAFDYPCVLYNLGGVFMNLVITVPCLILCLLPGTGLLAGTFCISMTVVGLFIALTNGLPLKLSGVANDGCNALALRRNTAARRAFWLQLKMNAEITEGVRLKDMPDDWFEVDRDVESLKNPLICAILVQDCCRLIDAHRFDEAARLADFVLEQAPGLLGLYRSQLRTEQIFCLLMRGGEETAENLLTDDVRQYLKGMAFFPSTVRFQYAHALLAERETAKAEACLKEFEKLEKIYPYQGELESERELLELIRGRAASSSV